MKTNRHIARLVILGTLLYAASLTSPISANAPVPSEVEEVAAAARATLARLPPEPRLVEIKNERLRHAVQATYRVVNEIADNRQAEKLASLNYKFERAYASVVRETARVQETTRCASNCKAVDGEPCQQKCRTSAQKVCGCNLIVFGCLVAECLF
jgi:hypothetical protein